MIRPLDGVDRIVMASDARRTGGLRARCRLCLRVRSLCLSHVLPKWTYRWIRQENTGKPLKGFYHSYGFVELSQDANKHYLLCVNCEQQLGDGERYARQLMTEGSTGLEACGVSVDGSRWSGIDAMLIRRYVLGTLLRVHYAPSPPFTRIRFLPAVIKSLRRILLGVGGAENSMLITPIRLHAPDFPGVDVRALVFVHYIEDTPWGELVTFVAGGWDWQVWLNERNQCQYPVALNDGLRQDRPLFVCDMHLKDARAGSVLSRLRP